MLAEGSHSACLCLSVSVCILLLSHCCCLCWVLLVELGRLLQVFAHRIARWLHLQQRAILASAVSRLTTRKHSKRKNPQVSGNTNGKPQPKQPIKRTNTAVTTDQNPRATRNSFETSGTTEHSSTPTMDEQDKHDSYGQLAKQPKAQDSNPVTKTIIRRDSTTSEELNNGRTESTQQLLLIYSRRTTQNSASSTFERAVKYNSYGPDSRNSQKRSDKTNERSQTYHAFGKAARAGDDARHQTQTYNPYI